jgi:hypothetical protein
MKNDLLPYPDDFLRLLNLSKADCALLEAFRQMSPNERAELLKEGYAIMERYVPPEKTANK